MKRLLKYLLKDMLIKKLLLIKLLKDLMKLKKLLKEENKFLLKELLKNLFMLILMKGWDVNAIGLNLIAALGLMFAIGLKDDLVVSTPRAKIGGELLAICLILF